MCYTKTKILEPTVNGKPVKMELDTGAAVSLVSKKVWKDFWPKSELEKCNILLKTYTDKRLHVLGQLQWPSSPIVPTSSGRRWSCPAGKDLVIRLNWKYIKQVKKVTQGVDSLLQKYLLG